MKNIAGKTYILLSLILINGANKCYADPPLPTPVGRVVWIKGTTLKAVMPNKEQRLLQKSSLIYLSDLLITDEKTQAEIVFTDNSLMTFQPNTKFSIDKYSLELKKKSGSTGKYVMSLIEGGFRTITGLIAKNNPSAYQVNTPVATIGVRGTDYAAYARAGKVYVAYYGGEPCVTSKNGTQLCLNGNTPYAYVPDATSSPQGLKQRPDVFNEKLEITPAKIAPFSTGVGGSRTGGPISSFCIS